MGKKEVKTNAMRILDRKKISYEYQTYECDEFTDGIETADKLNLPHEQVYKTLSQQGKVANIMFSFFRSKQKLILRRLQKRLVKNLLKCFI